MDYFIRSGFFRVGGVAEEPGHMAIFYNIYFGIALFYLKQSNQAKKIWKIVLLFLACHFAVFSTAGIALAITAGILIFIINRLKTLKITRKQIDNIFIASVLLFFAFALILWFDIGNLLSEIQEFSNKVFFNESHKDYSSSGARIGQWTRAFRNFIKHPILGSGPGFGVEEDLEGYLSVYLSILSDVGILAFTVFIAFQRALVLKVMALDKRVRNLILFSVITSFLHLVIISDFYHAPLWILFIFIQLVYKEEKLSE